VTATECTAGSDLQHWQDVSQRWMHLNEVIILQAHESIGHEKAYFIHCSTRAQKTWDGRPFGQLRRESKSGGCCATFRGEAGFPSNTTSKHWSKLLQTPLNLFKAWFNSLYECTICLVPYYLHASLLRLLLHLLTCPFYCTTPLSILSRYPESVHYLFHLHMSVMATLGFPFHFFFD